MDEKATTEALHRRIAALEQELSVHRSQPAHQDIVEGLPSLICRFLPDSTITLANRAYCEYFGKTRDELIGRSFLDLIPQQDHEEIKKKYNSLTRENPRTTYEHQVITPRGIRWQKWTDQAIFNEQGHLVEYQSIGEDITERKQNEDAVRESRIRLAQFIDFLPDATLAIDREGTVTTWNRAMEKLTLTKAHDMLGKGDFEYALVFHGSRRPVLVDCVLKPDKQIEDLYTHLMRIGPNLFGEAFVGTTQRYYQCKASPIYDHEGVLIGAIETVRDITTQKDAELKLRASEERYRLLAENIRDVI